MNNLITINQSQINNESVQAVNARELHAFLENGDNFTTWIKDRIKQYDFAVHVDFISFSENTKKPNGGRPSIEYQVTLDMAKELSMVERNAKGKEARQYFIACEKQLTSQPALPDFTSPAIAARAWAEQFEARQLLENQVKIDAPKVDFANAVMDSNDLIDVGSVAKVLNIKNVGRNTLFAILRDIGVLQSNNQPYQKYIDQGWFKVVESKFSKPSGDICINLKTMVYQKGVDGIRKKVLAQLEVAA